MHLIVGGGEIGSSLQKVIGGQIHDPAKGYEAVGVFQIMHVCIPYSEKFEEIVKEYQAKWNPKYTVIHSTVKVGTSRRLNAIHSPVIGIHPNLESGLRTFTKFLGGEQASEVADFFRRAGLKVYLFDKQETTELMKILDTTFYGVCIEYTKDVKRLADEYGVPFEAWTLWTENYNRGYEALGHSEFVRPNLTPIMKKIGGHCVKQNSLLVDNRFTDLINKSL